MAKDQFHNLKLIAYKRATLEGDTVDLDDFVEFCRMHLCHTYKVPFNSSVWDSYTDEQVMIEYFALKFIREEKFRSEFENKLKGIEPVEELSEDEFLEWAKQMEINNRKEVEELKQSMEKSIDFTPNMVE